MTRCHEVSHPTVRDVTYALLRGPGMTTVFGNPGSTELSMFLGFPDDFRYVLGLQESVVVGMADGFAQATRDAAFINLHSAVGLVTQWARFSPLTATVRRCSSLRGSRRAASCPSTLSCRRRAPPSYHVPTSGGR